MIDLFTFLKISEAFYDIIPSHLQQCLCKAGECCHQREHSSHLDTFYKAADRIKECLINLFHSRFIRAASICTLCTVFYQNYG